jgi:hypothetical protein
MLRKLRLSSNSNIMKSFYYAFVHSHLIYCLEIWGNLSEVNKTMLYRLQKKAIRIIANKPRLFGTKMLFIDLEILPFANLYVYYNCIALFKKIAHDDFHIPVVISAATRSSSRPFHPIPSQRSYIFSRSPLIVELRTFNWIGQELMNLKTLYSAKIFLRRKLFDLFKVDYDMNIINKGIFVSQLHVF